MSTIKTIAACAFIAFAAAVIGPNIDHIASPSDLQVAQDAANDAVCRALAGGVNP